MIQEDWGPCFFAAAVNLVCHVHGVERNDQPWRVSSNGLEGVVPNWVTHGWDFYKELSAVKDISNGGMLFPCIYCVAIAYKIAVPSAPVLALAFHKEGEEVVGTWMQFPYSEDVFKGKWRSLRKKVLEALNKTGSEDVGSDGTTQEQIDDSMDEVFHAFNAYVIVEPEIQEFQIEKETKNIATTHTVTHENGNTHAFVISNGVVFDGFDKEISTWDEVTKKYKTDHEKCLHYVSVTPQPGTAPRTPQPGTPQPGTAPGTASRTPQPGTQPGTAPRTPQPGTQPGTAPRTRSPIRHIPRWTLRRPGYDERVLQEQEGSLVVLTKANRVHKRFDLKRNSKGFRNEKRVYKNPELEDMILPGVEVSQEGNVGTIDMPYVKIATENIDNNSIAPRDVREARELIKKFHNAGFVHNDIHGGNLVTTLNGMRLIDFELSEPFGQNPLADRKRDASKFYIASDGEQLYTTKELEDIKSHGTTGDTKTKKNPDSGGLGGLGGFGGFGSFGSFSIR